MRAQYGVELDDDEKVVGSTCEQCGFNSAPALPACSVCGREMVAKSFAPMGTVWARTLISFAVHGTSGPSEFAYVDLDDGPRLLVRNNRPDGKGTLTPGDRVAVGVTDGVLSVTSQEELHV